MFRRLACAQLLFRGDYPDLSGEALALAKCDPNEVDVNFFIGRPLWPLTASTNLVLWATRRMCDRRGNMRP